MGAAEQAAAAATALLHALLGIRRVVQQTGADSNRCLRALGYGQMISSAVDRHDDAAC